MPIAVEQAIYLLERQMAAVYPVSLREVIYLRIAQNYYENLKEKTTTTKLQQNQNLYILQQRLCCHHYFEHWFYVTWQRYEENKREKKREKNKKEKEKRHTKQLCKRRYESTGASEAGGPLMDYPVIEPNTLNFFIIYNTSFTYIFQKLKLAGKVTKICTDL